jgi:hypothetical protein
MCQDKILFIVAVILLGVSIYVSVKYIKKDSSESYCSGCYRTVSLGTDCRTNCGMCKGFSNSYDYLCPHNCRNMGVAVCNQGKMM